MVKINKLIEFGPNEWQKRDIEQYGEGYIYSGFGKAIKCMNFEQAKQIRKWRIEENNTWRGIAFQVSDQNWDWSNDIPEGNQLAGMGICERAAEFFGESYVDSLWNRSE